MVVGYKEGEAGLLDTRGRGDRKGWKQEFSKLTPGDYNPG